MFSYRERVIFFTVYDIIVFSYRKLFTAPLIMSAISSAKKRKVDIEPSIHIGEHLMAKNNLQNSLKLLVLMYR